MTTNGFAPPTRRALLAGAGTVLAMPAVRRAWAATPVVLGYTATLGFNGAFIAKERGFFAQQGLDVTLQLIALNSNIPGAMVGGSVQIGGPTPTVLIQANDGGLDLVVVAGCAGLYPSDRSDGLIARKGSGIAAPADCVGRKIGVPGLNAAYHVLVRKWLADAKVDWRRVYFVETPFTQSADVLRSGSVDAVVTGQPFAQRIVADGGGTMVVAMSDIVPAATPSLFYAATRDWAAAHPDAVRAFRSALAQAVRSQVDDPAGAMEIAGRYIKLPPEIMSSIKLQTLQSEVSPAQVATWVEVMEQQGMLSDKPDPAKLLAP